MRLRTRLATLVGICLPVIICSVAAAQSLDRIPNDLLGTWVVVKELNTRTISCWGEKDAKKILGTSIRYSPDSLSWGSLHTKVEGVKVRAVTADEFRSENSSPSVNGSQVDFQQLGIKAARTKQVTIQHLDADVTGATVEFPGDEALIKTPNTFVFSLCNVYFEAKRVAKYPASKKESAGK
jgi:hypothetical protein